MGRTALATTSDAPAAPLYERLADDLAHLVATGALKIGDRLPSVRSLSRQRGVSVSTVLQAYLQLENRGLVETRPQSGHYVRAARLAPIARAAAAALVGTGDRA